MMRMGDRCRECGHTFGMLSVALGRCGVCECDGGTGLRDTRAGVGCAALVGAMRAMRKEIFKMSQDPAMSKSSRARLDDAREAIRDAEIGIHFDAPTVALSNGGEAQ